MYCGGGHVFSAMAGPRLVCSFGFAGHTLHGNTGMGIAIGAIWITLKKVKLVCFFTSL
jgi:hypothetical protein